MDAKCYLSGENAICNESTIKQSLLRRSSRNKELSSASSISPSMSISVGENSAVSQFSGFFQVNEIDRIISDQGLIMPKERPNTPRRKIRDKSYYKGLIHLKTQKIFDEMKKLQKEISLLNDEQRMYIPYKKKAESKAMDLQNLQKSLVEYNFLDDMIHRHIQLGEAKQELQKLKAFNTSENAKVEKLFAMAEQKEVKVKEIESNISQENEVSDILTKTTNSRVSERLENLKRMDFRLQILRTEQEKELVDLKKERGSLENQCRQNEVLNEELELTKKLWSSEEKRNEFHSGKKFVSLQEEYEYLQKYESECSILLKGIMKENKNIENKIQNTVEELKKMENESYNPYSDRYAKYSKLRKSEKIIDEYLSCYSDEQGELLTKQQQQECEIVELLEEISSKINSFGSDLQDENDKIFLTDHPMISKEKMKIVKATKMLEEACDIESKALEERDRLKNQITTFESKILSVSNIDKLKENSKVRKTKLLNEFNQVKKQKYAWNNILNDLKKHHDSLQKELHRDNTYTMLSELEKQWHLSEKENLAMENLIASSKDFQKEYLLLKDNVRKLSLEVNNML